MLDIDAINAHEHAEKKYIDGNHENIHVKVQAVINTEIDKEGNQLEKPYSLVTLACQSGPMKGSTLRERIPHHLSWRVKQFVFACGVSEENDKGEPQVPSYFTDLVSLVGKQLLIDTKVNIWNGSEYTNVSKMNPFLEDETDEFEPIVPAKKSKKVEKPLKESDAEIII